MAQMQPVYDKLLSNVSNMYLADGYISEQIFPYLPVVQTTGQLGKYGTNHLRLENALMGGAGKYRRVQPISRSTSQYHLEGHGLEDLVSFTDYQNVYEPYSAERDSVTGLTSLLWTEKEVLLATSMADTTIVTQNTTLAGGNQFSDYANSNPVGVFATARAQVRAGCGLPPDTAWMEWDVANILRYHPQLLDTLGFKWDKPGGLTDAQLAQSLGVPRLLIASAKYEAAVEGQASSFSSIWGKHVWFGVCPASPQIMQVSAGYRLGIQGSQPRKVYKYPSYNPPNGNLMLVEDWYQYFITNAGALYMVKNAIA